MHHLAAPATAIYLPDSGSLPRWVGIVVGAVVVAMACLRLYRFWRSWRRRR
ncbi:hypothetical protein LZP81_13210 [Streptomyces parvulus]|uniref:Uncharacterized protein n=1 Tax=Streptomyces parvulus TaxID=146923 RepID=A0ABV5DIY4_9ACTN|nr:MULTISPECIES: hypothetical protein [Streptomyces]MCC9155560.1 hypothetical protein [Streptomyces parvulus]MCE7687814.1 hypothetical protein [Streptomyces parvulus]MCQ4192760.1 hypothetical protein [Streptomyces parvulus]WHM29148.1 hypothetical protein OH540_03565 [Streptomyces sp. BPPL-273]WML83971.1 hypothetical protein Q3101_30720 [Streptomyces sp. VNUA74]